MQTPTSSSTPGSPNRGWQMPDTLLIVAGVLLLALLLTALLAPGQFETRLDAETGRHLLQAGSYQAVGEASLAPLFTAGEHTGFFSAFFDGMTSGSRSGSAIGVVVFILLVGGSFGIVLRTGAIDEMLKWLINRLQHKARLLLPVMALFFSLGGAVFGMGEEAMAFAVFLVPLVKLLGYDAITGVLLTYGATQVGFATSWMNPFSVAIAQSIAGLPPLSGAGFRMGLWLVFTLIYILWMMTRAERLRKDQHDAQHGNKQPFALEHRFAWPHLLIVLCFAAGMVWLVWGVVTQGYYLREIASQFLVIGCVSALLARLFLPQHGRSNDYVDAFKTGAAQLLPAAMVVGIAQGILLLLGGTDPAKPSVINTILQHAASTIDGHSSMVAAQGMLVFQSAFNFLVTSGSGQAALTMPLMAPLSDLVGVSRQTAVLAFQLGDGLAHLFYPTSPALMGTLAIAGVEFSRWLKAMWSLWLLLTLMSISAMAIAVWIGF
ncbi:MAG: putative basic amino acid antiporter YfcC [Rheinheimera sp.]|nr:putative basic amino acid antiporter YfcC [Rheinheimera sp.]